MIGNNHRQQQQHTKQLLNCLGQQNKMSTTALKAHHHTAAMAPSFEPNHRNTGKAAATAAMTSMSSLAADLCKVATAAVQAPPMEAAVVVNSIIYAKPSFCSIVVDIGGKGAGGTTSPPPPLAGLAKSQTLKTAKPPSSMASNNNNINKEKSTTTNHLPPHSWFSSFPPHQQQQPQNHHPFGSQFATTAGYFPMAAPTAMPTTAIRLDDRDAHVYMMCTTINGSINHQISDLCDNLIAMGLFGMTNSEHDDDEVEDEEDAEDDLIEFAYDDNVDDLKQNINFSDDDDDDEDDDDEDEDDEDDMTDDDEDLDLNGNDDCNCLYDDDDDGEDVVDFIKSPPSYSSSTCPFEKVTNIFCDKKKKVRFNTKPVVHVMHTWNYAYRAARKGNWEMYARDRERFKMRIERLTNTLNRILEPEHRQKIYEQRFAKPHNAATTTTGPSLVETEKVLTLEEVPPPPPKKKQIVQPPANANTKAKKRQRWKKRMRRRPKF